jgi:hypothetical protein
VTLGENGVPKIHLYFSYFCESNFATTIFAANSNVPAGWLVAVVLEVMGAAGLGGGRSSIELDNFFFNGDVILGRGEGAIVLLYSQNRFLSVPVRGKKSKCEMEEKCCG